MGSDPPPGIVNLPIGSPQAASRDTSPTPDTLARARPQKKKNTRGQSGVWRSRKIARQTPQTRRPPSQSPGKAFPLAVRLERDPDVLQGCLSCRTTTRPARTPAVFLVAPRHVKAPRARTHSKLHPPSRTLHRASRSLGFSHRARYTPSTRGHAPDATVAANPAAVPLGVSP